MWATENELRKYISFTPKINIGREGKGKKILEILTRTIPNLNEYVVADLGCSNGIITKIIASKVKFTYGFDLDISLTGNEEDLPNNLKFSMCNIQKCPLPDNSVDLIICNHVYYWFEQPEHLVAEIKRIIKPNGYVYFSGATRFSINGEQGVLFAPIISNKNRRYWMRFFGKKDFFELNYFYPHQIVNLFSEFKNIGIFPYFVGMKKDKPKLIWNFVNLFSYISPTAVYLFKKEIKQYD